MADRQKWFTNVAKDYGPEGSPFVGKEGRFEARVKSKGLLGRAKRHALWLVEDLHPDGNVSERKSVRIEENRKKKLFEATLGIETRRGQDFRIRARKATQAEAKQPGENAAATKKGDEKHAAFLTREFSTWSQLPYTVDSMAPAHLKLFEDAMQELKPLFDELHVAPVRVGAKPLAPAASVPENDLKSVVKSAALDEPAFLRFALLEGIGDRIVSTHAFAGVPGVRSGASEPAIALKDGALLVKAFLKDPAKGSGRRVSCTGWAMQTIDDAKEVDPKTYGREDDHRLSITDPALVKLLKMNPSERGGDGGVSIRLRLNVQQVLMYSESRKDLRVHVNLENTQEKPAVGQRFAAWFEKDGRLFVRFLDSRKKFDRDAVRTSTIEVRESSSQDGPRTLRLTAASFDDELLTFSVPFQVGGSVSRFRSYELRGSLPVVGSEGGMRPVDEREFRWTEQKVDRRRHETNLLTMLLGDEFHVQLRGDSGAYFIPRGAFVSMRYSDPRTLELKPVGADSGITANLEGKDLHVAFKPPSALTKEQAEQRVALKFEVTDDTTVAVKFLPDERILAISTGPAADDDGFAVKRIRVGILRALALGLGLKPKCRTGTPKKGPLGPENERTELCALYPEPQHPQVAPRLCESCRETLRRGGDLTFQGQR